MQYYFNDEIIDDYNEPDSSDSNSFYKVSGDNFTQISSISIKNNTNFYSGNENYQIILGFKLRNMSNIFCGCKSLLSLPDLPIWNTSKDHDMSKMFNGCKS